MNEKNKQRDPSEKSTSGCQRCGKKEAYVFAGQRLCRECFQLYGSCCLEFGGDDLWKEREEETETGSKESKESKDSTESTESEESDNVN